MPRFSIIIPLYNKAPYVRKALDSVIAQTFADWECIIIDDGSTDGSAAICEEFIHSLSPSLVQSFCLLRQANKGVASARNNGVAASHAPYICFLDADDWWEPTFLEEMDRLISDYPDAGIYTTNYVYYKPGKTHVALSLPRGYMNYPEAYLQCGSMPVTSITTCMPRKVFDEMGGFPVGIKLGEDFLLWAKTAIHYPVAFSEKPLAFYNNDVPASLRATRNLHAPEHHMLFNLEPLELELARRESVSPPFREGQGVGFRLLLDKLRISGLLEYWMSDVYHDVAAAELAKVDWSKQPRSAKAQYEKPILLLKAKRQFMQIGSYCKQKLIRKILK